MRPILSGGRFCVETAKGTSLIEATLIITTVGFLTLLLATIPNSLMLIGKSRNTSVAREIASKKIEGVRKTNYDNLISSAFTDTRFSFLPESNGQVIIEDCPPSLCTGSENTKQATVIVTWKEGANTKTLTMRTLITNKVAPVLTPTPTDTPAPPPNLIANPGFESAIGNEWTSSYNSTITAVTTPVHSGAKAAKVQWGEGGDNYMIDQQQISGTCTAAGTQYIGKVWLVGSSNTGGELFRFQIRERTADWSFPPALSTPIEANLPTTAQGWQQFTLVAYAKQRSDTCLDIFVEKFGGAAGEHFFADDFEMYLAGGILTSTPTPTPTLTLTPTPTTPPSGNLLANPGFESVVAPWYGNSGSVTRVGSGTTAPRSGSWSGEFTASGGDANITNWPGETGSYSAGQNFSASVWVKGGTTTKSVELVMQEQPSGTNVAWSGVIQLTSGWQQLTIPSYTTISSGSNISLYVYIGSSVNGNVLYVDDWIMTRN